MKRFLRSIRTVLISAVILVIMLEIGSFIAIKAGFINVALPSYSLSGADWFWKVINPDYGVWHEPNDEMHHHKRCIDVTYTSNAFGMRDAEVAKTSDAPRVVVLGDSFVEGLGVPSGKRFTEILERDQRTELLNFGTSGGFGPTQAYVLYKTFASGFSHDAVILGILPDNDFFDDTPSDSQLGPNARWRPFLVGTYPDYALAYPDRDFEPDMVGHRRFQAYINEFWITSRVFDYYKAYFRAQKQRQEQLSAGGRDGGNAAFYSGYYDYDAEQFRRLKYVIEQVKAIAGDRPLLVVTIPRQADFKKAAERQAEPRIRKDLTALSKDLGFAYIDLMVGMAGSDDLDSYFLECDGHWSEKGHAKAAEIIGAWPYFDQKRD